MLEGIKQTFEAFMESNYILKLPTEIAAELQVLLLLYTPGIKGTAPNWRSSINRANIS